MEKYLITGFAGFVSKHFIDYLEDKNVNAEILGIDILEPSHNARPYKSIALDFVKMDLLDKERLQPVIHDFQPQYILHLASYSSVSFSWKNPVVSFKNNTTIFLNLLELLRELNSDARLLSVGSSEEYGNVRKEDIPLEESHALNPVSPYAVARVSQELLSRVYCESFGMNIVITRSFNHIGPGQKDIFVVPSFAKQLIEIKKKGEKKGSIDVGDISIVRDFLDVRDVVEAYHKLLTNGRKGEVYNVCSGIGVSLKEIVDMMADILNIKVDIHVNERLIRPNDNKIIIGSNEKIRRDIEWTNKILLSESITDLIKYWDANV